MAKKDGWLVKLFLSEEQAKPFIGVLPEFATDLGKTAAKREQEAAQLGIERGKHRPGVIDTGRPFKFFNRSVDGVVKDLETNFVLAQEPRCYPNPKRPGQWILLIAYDPEGERVKLPDGIREEILELSSKIYPKIFGWDNPQGKKNTLNCTP